MTSSREMARTLEIVGDIDAGRCTTLSELCEAYGVSAPTVKRSIAAARQNLGVPIDWVCTYGGHGYYQIGPAGIDRTRLHAWLSHLRQHREFESLFESRSGYLSGDKSTSKELVG